MRMCHFKKYLSLSMVLFASLTAAEDRLWVDDYNVPMYQDVQIAVNLQNSFTAVQQFSFNFLYEDNYLTYQGFESGVLTSDFDALTVTPAGDGILVISGQDILGIPAGNNDTLILLNFATTIGWSNLRLSNPTGDLAGFELGEGSCSYCTPEFAWLTRSLPETCIAGEPFMVQYSYAGGSATVVQTSETLPEGWQVLSPPWNDLVGNTYIWNTALSSCTVLPPADGLTGTYYFSGETVSNHWCNGYVTHLLDGDNSVFLWGVDPTPTPVCLHTGDVNFDLQITAGDAQISFFIALGMYQPTWDERCAADCNGDEFITAGDAQLVFMAALGAGECNDPVIIPSPTNTPTVTPTLTPTPTPTPTSSPTPTPNFTPSGYSVSGNIYEFPQNCMGYMRGWTIVLEPLGIYTVSDLNAGYFEFQNIPDGAYTLVASPRCNPFGCWPNLDITVSGANVTGIRMCPEPL